MPAISTLSITGHGVPHWTHFKKHVDYDSKGQIVRGSFGIGYDLRNNLDDIFQKTGGDYDKMIQEIKTIPKIFKDEWKTGSISTDGKEKNRYTSQRIAERLVKFYRFAKGDQPYFFLRKGHEVLGLCKKTSGYIYDLKPDDSHYHIHRISFDFVRLPTTQEQEDFDKGPGKSPQPMAVEDASFNLEPPSPPGPTAEDKKKAQLEAFLTRKDEIAASLEDLMGRIRILLNEKDSIDLKIKDLTD
jgi:hypothetical protein